MGPINPINPQIWPFIDTLFAEIMQLFPDKHVHFGGDEVSFDCWASNPQIIEYMREHAFKDGDFKALEAEFFHRLLTLAKLVNVTSIVWQEAFSNIDDLAPETIVQIWTGDWRGLMIDVINKNHSAILSACWYLDDIKGGGDWLKYYLCDPWSFDGTPQMKKRVLGGEACMWSEFVDK